MSRQRTQVQEDVNSEQKWQEYGVTDTKHVDKDEENPADCKKYCWKMDSHNRRQLLDKIFKEVLRSTSSQAAADSSCILYNFDQRFPNYSSSNALTYEIKKQLMDDHKYLWFSHGAFGTLVISYFKCSQFQQYCLTTQSSMV